MILLILLFKIGIITGQRPPQGGVVINISGGNNVIFY
jgi:hypothetical protein